MKMHEKFLIMTSISQSISDTRKIFLSIAIIAVSLGLIIQGLFEITSNHEYRIILLLVFTIGLVFGIGSTFYISPKNGKRRLKLEEDSTAKKDFEKVIIELSKIENF